MSQFVVVRLAQPADLLADIERPQLGEAGRARLDAQKAGQVVAVGVRRAVEDRVGVYHVADLEVEIGKAVAAGGEHLGEHRDDAVLVLREPLVRVVHMCVGVAQVVVHLHHLGDDGRQQAAVDRVFRHAVDHLHHGERHREDARQLAADALHEIRRLVEPEGAAVGEVPVAGVLAEEVHLEALEELQPAAHVPLACRHLRAGRQNEHEARVFVVGQVEAVRADVVVDAVVTGHHPAPAAEVVPAAADRLAARRHRVVADALRVRVSHQHALRTEQEQLPFVVVVVRRRGGRRRR